MRYLFGDSEVFPLPYDFLHTLEIFMRTATRVVLLETEARLGEQEVAAEAAIRTMTLDSLESFHDEAVGDLKKSASQAGQVITTEYATQLVEHANRWVGERRRAAQAATAHETEVVSVKNAARAAEVRIALEELFRSARVPVTAREIAMELSSGQCELRASFTHPAKIVSSFALPVDRGWSLPRRVSELAPGLEPRAGVKKKWLSDEVSAEKLRLDDHILGGFELAADRATIKLRKKGEPVDTLVFHLARAGSKVAGQIEHPGHQRADALPSELEADDAVQLERLWQAIASAVEESVDRRTRLIGLTIEGADAVGSRSGTLVIEELVALLAPTVVEIARRSPNDHELTLKREGDDGKREELYLRKSELVGKLEPLPASGRAVFKKLGLETWMPSTTIPPPMGVPGQPSAPRTRPPVKATTPPPRPPAPAPAPPTPPPVRSKVDSAEVEIEVTTDLKATGD